MIPPKSNKYVADARGIPVRSKQIHEPITYVPETGFFRENIPSPWDTNLSEGFNYGELPTPTVRYAVIERQPGQNAWSNKFTGVDDQLVIHQPDVNAYNFEDTKYNRYKPRVATIVNNTDDDNWEPWSVKTEPPVITTPTSYSRRSPIVDDDIDLGELDYFHNSVPANTDFVAGIVRSDAHTPPVAVPPPATTHQQLQIIDDDIDIEELGYFAKSVPANEEFVAGVARGEALPLPAVDSYDFDAPQYAYQAKDDINNFRSGTIAAPRSQPNHIQLEIDFNNPLHNNNSSLPYAAKEYVATLSPLERFKLGLREGNSFGVGEDYSQANFDPTGKAYYSKSIVFDRANKSRYDHLDPIGQAGFIAGRVGADIYGNGTRKYLWNIQPEDFTNTEGKAIMNHAGATRTAQLAIPYAATLALGIGSGNYNPLNISQGGRPDGFSAVNPGDDPRQSTSPLYDIAIERGMLGRRGRLLPWQQFQIERPDISFDQYDKYNRYLTNKDPNLLRQMTGGLAKGTLDGINGPEVNVMGYSVNPIGAAAAAGIIALGRISNLRK